MAGVKRARDGVKIEQRSDNGSPYIPMFEGFRAELDEHHDRRERIIKASRDITAQSKKIIFALQRARKVGSPLPQSIITSSEPMYSTITNLFGAIRPDLGGINAYRYQRNVSGGIQEYMEAVLFQHYLETEKLMPHQEAVKMVPEEVHLTLDDYVLGLFDTTGELMRFAITYLATNGSLPESETGNLKSNILSDMQDMRSYLENVDANSSFVLGREFGKKLQVTKESVEKVEYGVYQMLVRGNERPKGWRPDATEGLREKDEVEAY